MHLAHVDFPTVFCAPSFMLLFGVAVTLIMWMVRGILVSYIASIVGALTVLHVGYHCDFFFDSGLFREVFFSCISLKYRGFPLLLVNIAVRKGAMLFTVILDLSPFQYFIDSGTCLSDLFHIVCSAVPTVVWC